MNYSGRRKNTVWLGWLGPRGRPACAWRARRSSIGPRPAQLWLDQFQHHPQPDRPDFTWARHRCRHTLLCLLQRIQRVSAELTKYFVNGLMPMCRAYRRYRRSPLERVENPFVSLANCLSETEDDGVGMMARLLEVCSGDGLVACAKQLWGVCGLTEVGWWSSNMLLSCSDLQCNI